ARRFTLVAIYSTLLVKDAVQHLVDSAIHGAICLAVDAAVGPPLLAADVSLGFSIDIAIVVRGVVLCVGRSWVEAAGVPIRLGTSEQSDGGQPQRGDNRSAFRFNHCFHLVARRGRMQSPRK